MPLAPPSLPRRAALRPPLASVVLGAALLAACSSPSSGAPVERSPGSAGASAVASSGAKTPASAEAAAQRKACSAPCRGSFATLTVWRDAQGAVKRYVSPGSPGDCSHPPMLFFDERGEQTGAIPLVPVTPGSEQARKFDAIRQEQTAGLRQGEEIRCEAVQGR